MSRLYPAFSRFLIYGGDFIAPYSASRPSLHSEQPEKIQISVWPQAHMYSLPFHPDFSTVFTAALQALRPCPRSWHTGQSPVDISPHTLKQVEHGPLSLAAAAITYDEAQSLGWCEGENGKSWYNDVAEDMCDLVWMPFQSDKSAQYL